MTVHINRFVDKLAGAEARNSKDLILTIQEAKGLHQDITRLLLALDRYQVPPQSKVVTDDLVEIRVSGGSFKDR